MHSSARRTNHQSPPEPLGHFKRDKEPRLDLVHDKGKGCGVQEAARGATQVSGNISEVTRGAADTGSSAEQVHEAAQELLVESNHLKGEVGNFLASVRAA